MSTKTTTRPRTRAVRTATTPAPCAAGGVAATLAALSVNRATVPAAPGGWVPIITGTSVGTARWAGTWAVYAVDGGKPIGELWQSRGEWTAHDRGRGVLLHARRTREGAITDAGWLDTIQAADLAAGYAGPAWTSLVLADGTAVHVHDAVAHVAARSAIVRPGVWRNPSVSLVTVAVETVGRVAMRNPGAVATVDGPATLAAGGLYRLTFEAGTRLALTPGCGDCSAAPGVPCGASCPEIVALRTAGADRLTVNT